MLDKTDNAPAWLEDARWLKAHADCPRGLAQFVVSEGTIAYVCKSCQALKPDGFACKQCGRLDFAEAAYPGRDTVPDLSDSDGGSANEGRIAAAIRGQCSSVDVAWERHLTSVRFTTLTGARARCLAMSRGRPTLWRERG